MERDFKGIWIPKHIWESDDISFGEKFLLSEIDSLAKNGECFASNDYLAQFMRLSKGQISRMISSLSDKGFVKVILHYKPGTKQIIKRTIIPLMGYTQERTTPYTQECNTPVRKNAEDINTRFINTKNISVEVITYLNEKTNSNYSTTAKTNKELINGRVSEKHSLEDFKLVIDYFVQEWTGKTFSNGNKAENYLKPSVLFNTKFNERVNEARKNYKPSEPEKPFKSLSIEDDE